jgi:hypothetical protein
MDFGDEDFDMKRLLYLVGVVLATCSPALAGDHSPCCAACGSHQGLRKVCRFVCEEVEVTEAGWDCQCEDIVIQGKSPFCRQSVCNCGHKGCPHCTSRSAGLWHKKLIWGAPASCQIKTVKLLAPTEKAVKKKVWKPVIETVCSRCSGNHTLRMHR